MDKREVRDHHDGHGLAESIVIEAGPAHPVNGASHTYNVYVKTARSKPESKGELVGFLQYQSGPRDVEGSTPGVLDSVLLAIVADRMRGFQAGPFACRENALILTKAEEALHWIKHRADERARRGVLGKNEK